MIRLENISKQNGHQILFIEASATLLKGERVGLVGPNGAGKTTLFRMITGQEHPDEGQVAVDRGVTIGYFNQDVGEMSGRSAVSEVMDGAGPVSAVASELKQLEDAMVDPDRADDMEEIIERYGEVQGRFEELDGYALEGRAREILAGLSFTQEMMDGDVGALSGGWKMRVALARILIMRPDAMLLDEPSNHLDLESLIWLEEFLKAYEGVLLMTSHDREFMNRIVTKIVEIDGGALTTYSGNYVFYEQQRAQNEKQAQAQFERQQAMLAKEIKFIERFKARASHAAQVQSRVKKLEKIDRVEPPKRRQTVLFEFPPAPRSGDDVITLKNVHKSYGARRIYEGLNFQVRRNERWSPRAAASKWATSRNTRWSCSMAIAPCSSRWRTRSLRRDRVRCARWPAASASPATMWRRNAGCCRAARKRDLSWRRCFTTRRTFSFWTNPRTIWIWRPRRCSSRRCRNMRAPCCLSRTIVTFWPRYPIGCWN
ncbi:MAG: ABC transporter [Methylocystaceae bacterium]|nr:MAG: ABC transporter [Methylocystaceae bacterium]